MIVDDEQDILNLLGRILSRMGIESTAAATLAEAREMLREQSGQIDFCITDMRLPDGSGIDLVKELSSKYPEIPVAVITAFGSVETAVESLQAGAFDFVSKPIELDVLRKLITNAIKQAGARSGRSQDSEGSRLIGNSSVMLELKNKISKVARSQAPVLIYGESGTGKELVAREIHRLGPRSDQPFIAVNCGAIPGELMESEFFGHKKGSFTGAVADKEGLFRAAEGGTLFLDEIAELPMMMQVKLLRAIQERSVKPVGEHEEIKVDVRILSATHKDLQFEVEHERFRLDLFYRLNVIGLDLPPLRERLGDIPALVELLLKRVSHLHSDEELSLSPDALDKLHQHGFPGNVRELENILERASAFCEAGVIDSEDVQFDNQRVASGVSEPGDIDPGGNDQRPVSASDERSQLIQALEETHWNRTEAARKLGMTLRQIRYRIAKYDLEG